MTRMFRPISASLLLSSVLSTACGGGSSEYDSVASGLSALVADPDAGERRTFSDLILAWRGTAPADLAGKGSDLYSGRRGELEIELDIDCLDAEVKVISCELGSKAKAKLSTKGRTETTRYKIEIDRKLQVDLDVLDEQRVRVRGDVDFSLQADFRDHQEDVRHKYHFDADAKYDLVVLRADGVIESGKLTADVHAKEKLEEDETKFKSELKTKMTLEFVGGETTRIDFDSKSKYRLDLRDGALELE